MNPTVLRRRAARHLDDARKIQARLAGEEELAAEEVQRLQQELESHLTQAEQLTAQADSAEQQASLIQSRVSAVETTISERGRPRLPVGAGDPDAVRSRLPAEPRDHEEEGRRGFRSLGDFGRSVWLSALGQRDNRLSALFEPTEIGATQQAAVGSQGGFLIPPTFVREIWDLMQQASDNLLRLTNALPVEALGSISVPAIDETSRATGSRWGGVESFWLAEGRAITASEPKYRFVNLEPNGLAALIVATEKLLSSVPALGQFLTRVGADELNWRVGESIVRGNGAGKPLGILNAPALLVVAKETGQPADSITERNLVEMWARMPAWMRGSAVWIASQELEPELDLLSRVVKNVAGTENVGGYSSPVYNRDLNTIKGRPVIFTEFNAPLGDQGDIILFNPRAYQTVVRSGGIESAVSIHLYFDTARTAFRFMFYVDGQPLVLSKLTPAYGTSGKEYSPFVTLAART